MKLPRTGSQELIFCPQGYFCMEKQNFTSRRADPPSKKLEKMEIPLFGVSRWGHLYKGNDDKAVAAMGRSPSDAGEAAKLAVLSVGCSKLVMIEGVSEVIRCFSPLIKCGKNQQRNTFFYHI